MESGRKAIQRERTFPTEGGKVPALRWGCAWSVWLEAGRQGQVGSPGFSPSQMGLEGVSR